MFSYVSSGSIVSHSKMGSGRSEIFSISPSMSPSFVQPGPRQMKTNSGQALSFLCRYLKCRTRQKIGAHRSFTSTCWQRLGISITWQRQGPFIFQIFKYYVLFPDGGIIIFNAGAAYSTLSRSRTSWRRHGEICSTRPCRFQNSHHCLPLMVSSWSVFLNCSSPSLMSPSPLWPSPQHGNWSPTFSCSQSEDYWNFAARQLRISHSEVSSVMTEECFGLLFSQSALFGSSHTHSAAVPCKCLFLKLRSLGWVLVNAQNWK